MKKVVKAIGITTALAVLIPLSAYAAAGTGNGAGSAAVKAKAALTEMKDKEAHFVKPGFGFMEQEVLDLLKLDAQTLKSKLAAGQTLAQIAEAQGVSRDALKNALTDSFNKKLEEQKKAFSDKLDGMIDAKRNAFAEKQGRGFAAFGNKDLSAVLQLLGVTKADFQKAKDADKSLADIAKEKGVDLQKVIDTQKAAITKSINDAVKNGKLTQTEADKFLADAGKMAEKIVNGKGFHGRHEFSGQHDHE
jgi:hypothetical protein